MNKNHDINPQCLFLRTLAFCGALSQCLPSGQAATLVSADALGNLGTSMAAQSGPGGSVSQEQSGSRDTPGGNAAGRAFASFGVLRVFGEAHVDIVGGPQGGAYSTFAGGNAFFRDDFLITSPGLTGSGTLTFTLQIGGTLASTQRNIGTNTADTSAATASLQVLRNGSFLRNDSQTLTAINGVMTIDGVEFLNQVETISVPFTYGTPFELQIALGAMASANTKYGADSTANIENTLEWGGIVAVRDGGNNLVSNYTVGTTSGTDYSQAIPEPSMYGFVPLVLAGCVAFRRRYRQ